MPMYNLKEQSDNYSKTSGSLWQYYKDEPILDDNGLDFPADDNNCTSFKFKTKLAGRTGNDGTKNIKIRVPLKYPTLIWVGLLGVRFKVGGGGRGFGKIPPSCLNFVRIVLET